MVRFIPSFRPGTRRDLGIRLCLTIALLAVLGACSTRSDARSSRAQTDVPTSIVGDRSPENPSPIPGLSAQLQLTRRVIRVGSSVPAIVKVRNETGRRLEVPGCAVLFQAALARPGENAQPPWLLCMQLFPIPVGLSTYHVRVAAQQSTCIRPTSTTTSTAPPCQLPPGRYTATLFAGDGVFRLSGSRTVQVVE